MTTPPPHEPLGYKPAKVAEIPGLGRTTIFGLIKNGTLESVKVGKSRIVSAKSVRRLIEGETK